MAGFKKATKEQAYITIALEGGSGAGKSYTAEEIAKHLCPPGKSVYHIDSERGSASKYAHLFNFFVDDDFGTPGKLNYHPDVWIKKMQAAVAEGDCGVLILDSLTHLWKGEGGVLSVIEQVKKAQEARGRKADGFNAWQDGDKIYRRFMDTLLSLPCHRIVTVRSKTKYEKKQNDKGYMEVTKLGLEPEFRDGYEFEVDIQAQMTSDHTLIPLKHRLGPALDGKIFPNPGKDFAAVVTDWASTGSPKQAEPEHVVTVHDVTVSVPLTATVGAVELKAKLLVAQSEAELKLIGAEIRRLKDDKKITADDWTALAKVYSDRTKELKAVSS